MQECRNPGKDTPRLILSEITLRKAGTQEKDQTLSTLSEEGGEEKTFFSLVFSCLPAFLRGKNYPRRLPLSWVPGFLRGIF
jgi:hypothetical protein